MFITGRNNGALTNRVQARLQTFADGYEFHGSRQSVRRQMAWQFRQGVPGFYPRPCSEPVTASPARVLGAISRCRERIRMVGHRRSQASMPVAKPAWPGRYRTLLRPAPDSVSMKTFAVRS